MEKSNPVNGPQLSTNPFDGIIEKRPPWWTKRSDLMVPMYIPKTTLKLPVRVPVEVKTPEPFTAERLTNRAPSDDSLQRRLMQAEDALAFLLDPVSPEPVTSNTSEVDDLRARLAELEAENARLKEPAPEPHNFPANMSDRLTDWAEPGDLTTDDLTEDVIQKLTQAKRKKWTELLNVELAELQQERGGPREDLKREGVIEATLGLFSRVGEM